MKRPPQNALRLLRWFCREDYVEEIEGDLTEVFEKEYQFSARRAKWKFAWSVVKYFRPQFLKAFQRNHELHDLSMFKNYFTIAWRNLLKSKIFSAINIFGLAIGLAACIFLLQFVSFELSYDSFNKKVGRTYRVVNDRIQNGELVQHSTVTYPAVGPAMASDFPEIEECTRLTPAGDFKVRIDEKIIRRGRCYFADEHLFSVFDFKLLAGRRAGVLKEPHTAVLTASTARICFDIRDGNFTKLVGKIFYLGLDQTPYAIVGICDDIPLNSHIQFDGLLSYSSLYGGEDKSADNSWTWSEMRHYLVLKPGSDYQQLESKFQDFSERHFHSKNFSGTIEKFHLQPLKDAHLYSDYEYDIAKTANGKTVWLMFFTAVFIFVVAWVNYVNLTTSRAIDRAREVGLRKVMGAFRSQLLRQFTIESVMITAISLVIAVALVALLQNIFNEIVMTPLSLQSIAASLGLKQLLMLVLLFLAGVIIVGLYPAFILSSFRPAAVLKGKFTLSEKGTVLRKTLLVFQFALSAVLITATLNVVSQVNFMTESALGFEKSNIVVLKAPELMDFDSTFNRRVAAYKSELVKAPGVISCATSWRVPGDQLSRASGIRLSGQPFGTSFTLSHQGVDYDFFDTYGITLVAGRKFLPNDHHADFRNIDVVIINKSATQLLGIQHPGDAVGRKMVWGSTGRTYSIVGVVNDFHQQALQTPIEPMIFRPMFSTNCTSVRIRTARLSEALSQMKMAYNKAFPGNTFEYFFLEDHYQTQYDEEARFEKVISVFTILAIVVSCLGLIGLSAYITNQRSKEISVRKVLGASMTNVISILSIDFIRLVLLAVVLSFPITYLGIRQWLAGYAYHFTPGWMHFVLPAALIVILAAGSVIIQVTRIAKRNPADVLKYE